MTMSKRDAKIGGLLVLGVIVAMFVLSYCTLNMAMKPWSEQTPKERLDWMLGVYNAQDKDYRNLVGRGDLTAAQAKVLVAKKKIMVKVYPLLEAYRKTVNAGGIPGDEMESAILNLLNDLQSVGG